MQNCILALAIAGGVSLSTNAAAGTVISFDQLQVGEDVLNYYNGGMGSMGSGPGPADGVIFSAGWIAGLPDAYNAPGGKSVAISGTATVNVPPGWVEPTSFYYSGGPLTVSYYSQPNGLGTLLGTRSEPGSPFFSQRARTFHSFDQRFSSLPTAIE
jgi:hypothetical protein